MNGKPTAGQLGERRARYALSFRCAVPLAGRRSASDLVALTKPRVMMLAVFTALVGMSIAPARPASADHSLPRYSPSPRGPEPPVRINMWYDADIDAVMSRTAMRPIPRGKISSFEALVFGLVLGGFAVTVLRVGDEPRRLSGVVWPARSSFMLSCIRRG